MNYKNSALPISSFCSVFFGIFSTLFGKPACNYSNSKLFWRSSTFDLCLFHHKWKDEKNWKLTKTLLKHFFPISKKQKTAVYFVVFFSFNKNGDFLMKMCKLNNCIYALGVNLWVYEINRISLSLSFVDYSHSVQLLPFEYCWRHRQFNKNIEKIEAKPQKSVSIVSIVGNQRQHTRADDECYLYIILLPKRPTKKEPNREIILKDFELVAGDNACQFFGYW